MSLERVRTYLEKFDLDHKIIELETSSATVYEAAQALNTEAQRIAKTLAFRFQEGAHVIVVAGDMRIDNAKYKAHFNQKARFLNPEETFTWVGYHVGGVCPFALPESVQVFLDVSLHRFSSVFPACGNDHSAIELTLEELQLSTHGAMWVDVCKPIV